MARWNERKKPHLRSRRGRAPRAPLTGSDELSRSDQRMLCPYGDNMVRVRQLGLAWFMPSAWIGLVYLIDRPSSQDLRPRPRRRLINDNFFRFMISNYIFRFMITL